MCLYICWFKENKLKIERTNYKDKFLNNELFQWESRNTVSMDSDEGKKLLNSNIIHLFVRKMDNDNGITLPFTYFGTGVFNNPRESNVISINKKTNKEEINRTILFDIILDNKVSEEYYLDFEIPEEEAK